MTSKNHHFDTGRPFPAILLAASAMFIAPGYAGTQPPDQPTAPSEPSPKSAGLLNDALRQQSPAFEKWNIGGQFRFRYDLKHNGGGEPATDFIRRGVDNDNDVFLFRETLHLGWQPNDWVKFFVEGRGAHAASDDKDPSPGDDVWDLHQAWIELGHAETFPLTLKIGRQELLYGDQRFIGPGDWSNTGRVFDSAVIRAHLIKDTTWIDLFSGQVVLPRDGHFNESNEHDHFSGIYASSRDLWDSIETQAFFLARNVGAQSPDAIAPGIGGPSERDVYTYGLRLKSLPGALGPWDFAFEGAGQFGEIHSAGVARDLRAFALTGSAGYTFEEAWAKPRIGFGYDYASGDSNARDGRHETFEPLFGTNHLLYGIMDLTGLRNTSSPRVSLSLKPTSKLSISTEYLLFWLADTQDFFYPEAGAGRNANGYGRNSQFSSFAGSEIDFLLKYSLNKYSELQLGYGHFFPGSYIRSSVNSIKENGGVIGADWAYLQVVFNF